MPPNVPLAFSGLYESKVRCLAPTIVYPFAASCLSVRD